VPLFCPSPQLLLVMLFSNKLLLKFNYGLKNRFSLIGHIKFDKIINFLNQKLNLNRNHKL